MVSGLNINTSDIYAEAGGEKKDSESAGKNNSLFLLTSNEAEAVEAEAAEGGGILMSLIEPSVRKIGGGGAVSVSAFQVS